MQNSKFIFHISAKAHRVSVIIPTHNGEHLLPECLEALWRQSYRDIETIVVDDASTDGTHALLVGYPEVTTLETLPGTKGHGFVAAVNAGLAKSRGEIVVLLNNDAVPDPGWLGELVGALDRNRWAGMAASKLMLYDRPNTFHSTGDYYGLDGVPHSRGVWEADRGQFNLEEEVFGPCAAACAYRRSVLLDVATSGGTQPPYRVLDPQLWMYCEDVDLNLRARLRGHRTVYVPTACARHRLSATGGGALASYYVGRNLIYLIAKDLPLRLILRNLPGIALAQLRFAIEAIRHIRGEASRARLRGMAVGLLTWPRVLPSRRRIISSRILSTRQFERELRMRRGREITNYKLQITN
ncbi:MAG: glycosyltransferase family 2 protein [Chloroflexia bacterium]